jgi:hypothetical protein
MCQCAPRRERVGKRTPPGCAQRELVLE